MRIKFVNNLLYDGIANDCVAGIAVVDGGVGVSEFWRLIVAGCRSTFSYTVGDLFDTFIFNVPSEPFLRLVRLGPNSDFGTFGTITFRTSVSNVTF